MANVTPVFKPSNVSVDILSPTINNITNKTATLADTEISHTLQTSLKRLEISARNDAQLQFSFVLNDSGVTFKTIPPGCIYSSGDIDLSSATLYIQANIAGTVIEIEEWS